jgi:hypothetical protein
LGYISLGIQSRPPFRSDRDLIETEFISHDQSDDISYDKRKREVKTNFLQAGKDLTGYLLGFRIVDSKMGTGLKEVSPDAYVITRKGPKLSGLSSNLAPRDGCESPG